MYVEKLGIKIDARDKDLLENDYWIEYGRIVRREGGKRIFLHKEIAKRKGITGYVKFVSGDHLDLRRNNLKASKKKIVKNKISNTGHRYIYKSQDYYRIIYTRGGKRQYFGGGYNLDAVITLRDTAIADGRIVPRQNLSK